MELKHVLVILFFLLITLQFTGATSSKYLYVSGVETGSDIGWLDEIFFSDTIWDKEKGDGVIDEVPEPDTSGAQDVPLINFHTHDGQAFDKDDTGTWKAKPGNIMTNGNKFRSIISTQGTWSFTDRWVDSGEPGDKDDVNDDLEVMLRDTLDGGYKVKNDGRTCDIYKTELSNGCKVLSNSKGKLDGEIVVATEMETEIPDNYVALENYRFYSCGSDIAGKRVKAKLYRGTYTNEIEVFQCNYVDGADPVWQWEVVPECNDNIDNDMDGYADYNGKPANGVPGPEKSPEEFYFGDIGTNEVRAGCYGPEDPTEGCIPGKDSEGNYDNTADKDVDDDLEICKPLEEYNTAAWHDQENDFDILSYSGKSDAFTYKEDVSDFKDGVYDEGVYKRTGSDTLKKGSKYDGKYSLVKSFVTEIDPATRTDDNTEDPSSIPDKAGVLKCKGTISGQLAGYFEHISGAKYPSITGDSCGNKGSYYAVFNGTKHGYIATKNKDNVLAREGPHTQVLTSARNNFGVTDLCEIADGTWQSTGEISDINCKDEAPRGWSAVNHGQEEDTNSDLTGNILYSDLKSQIKHSGEVNNWVADDPDKVGFTGGFVPNCKSGRTLRYEEGWECGAGGGTTIEVDFGEIQDVKRKTEGYPVQLRIRSGEINDLLSAFDLNEEQVDRFQIRGQCWIGGKGTMPKDSAYIKNFKKQLSLGDNYVSMKLPARGDAEMAGKDLWDGSNGPLIKANMNKYSCMYGFIDSQKFSIAAGTTDHSLITSERGEVYPVKSSEITVDNSYNPSNLQFGGSESLDILKPWTAFQQQSQSPMDAYWKNKCSDVSGNEAPVCDLEP